MAANVSPAHPRAESIECWDEDSDFADVDHIPQHPTSPTYSRASSDRRRRESVSSSRMSIASTFDLDASEYGDREVALDDSPTAAIESAIRAGIPIPQNVPPSALVGGAIKRLGNNKKTRKVIAHDDWSEDLELPTTGNALSVKTREFPDAFQQTMDGRRSGALSPSRINLATVPTASSQLNKFRDSPDDDEDFFADCDGDDVPTLKVSPARQRPSLASMLLTPPMSETAPKSTASPDDDFEHDFEFPADAPLQLNLKKGDRAKQSSVQHIPEPGFEDWGEADSGIGGSYYGRESFTNGDDRRSTIAMVLSPSVSALESEDETPLDGLVLPEAGLPDLWAIMEKRRQAAEEASHDDSGFHAQKDLDDIGNEEFWDGIEIGEGEVFDTKKLTLNHNVKQKQTGRKRSPSRRTAVSLTFTTNSTTNTTSKRQTQQSTQQPPSVRSNRLSHGHPTLLPPIQLLEPVAERENQPQTVKRNPRNRWSTGPTISSDRWSGTDAFGATIPPPSIPQSRQETLRERNVGKKGSTRTLKPENAQPTTTSAQLLRAKRSMPNIAKSAGNQAKPTRAPPLPPPSTRAPHARPTSRASGARPTSSSANSSGRPTSSGSRPTSSGSRPTSSGSRPTSSGSRPPSSAGGRPGSRASGGRPPSRTELPSSRPKTPHGSGRTTFRHPVPFVPGGGSAHNSHHISAKASRHTLSRDELDRRPTSRLQQRTPRHSPSSSGASNITKKGGTPLVAPEHLRREAAAIGTMTQPTRKRNFGDGTELEAFDDLPTSAKLESRFTVNAVARNTPKVRPKSMNFREPGESPNKKLDRTNRHSSEVPRFARDTAASRNAREYTQQRLSMSTPPAPTSPNAERWKSQIAARSQATPRARKKPLQQKPHLIKPMGNINTLPKESAVNGMTYNPRTMRWEGNERDLHAFETTEHRTPPRQPALITKVNTSGTKVGIQVVGGMVFDPSRMCWLKVDEDPDDEGDPFEGVEDIPDDLMSVDNQSAAGVPGGNNSIIMGGTSNYGGAGGAPRLSGGFGEFVVGEEFDVGPMFVNRQRAEEEAWRKKVDGWISTEVATSNRFALKELLAEHR